MPLSEGSGRSVSKQADGREQGVAARWALARLICGYGYGAALPWLATELSFHMNALRGMRLTLSFAACASSAAFFGMGPSLVAIAVSALAFNHFVTVAEAPPPTPAEVVARTVAVTLVGLLLTLLTRQRSRAEQRVKTTATSLQELAEALMQAQQASGSAAWMFDTRTRVTRWYPGGAEIFGRPHEEITAMGSPTALVVAEDLSRIAAAAELTGRTGAPFEVEFRATWPNGEEHWLEARGVPLASDPRLWRGATIDITGRKRAEAALIRTEKLAVAGRLAASIAHEINNPLEAVINLCYLAKMTATDQETKSYIAMAEDELNRVAHITSQTLRFHRQQTAAVKTDLAETVRSIVDLYGSRLAQGQIAVSLECEPAPPLLCYAGEIRQVLANLIANAIDAMPEGGRLRLHLRASLDWRVDGQGGGGTRMAVRVTVADTGRGMSAETRRRLYEPFYTTKGDLGTGLGLWITAGIVEKHHGKLQVRSSTRAGASGSAFMLTLPYPAEPRMDR
jgi:PAS domain S-box-containing protein